MHPPPGKTAFPGLKICLFWRFPEGVCIAHKPRNAVFTGFFRGGALYLRKGSTHACFRSKPVPLTEPSFSLWPCRAFFMFLAYFDIIIMGRKQAAIAVQDDCFHHQLSQAGRNFLFFSKNSSANSPDFLQYTEGYIVRRNRCRVFSFGLVVEFLCF